MHRQQLHGGGRLDLIQDGIKTSIIVSGALQAKAALKGQSIDAREIRSFLELAGIGAGTALTVDALLNMV